MVATVVALVVCVGWLVVCAALVVVGSVGWVVVCSTLVVVGSVGWVVCWGLVVVVGVPTCAPTASTDGPTDSETATVSTKIADLRIASSSACRAPRVKEIRGTSPNSLRCVCSAP